MLEVGAVLSHLERISGIMVGMALSSNRLLHGGAFLRHGIARFQLRAIRGLSLPERGLACAGFPRVEDMLEYRVNLVVIIECHNVAPRFGALFFSLSYFMLNGFEKILC
jgi:hypothetical protein